MLHVPGVSVEEMQGYVVVFNTRNFLKEINALGALLWSAHLRREGVSCLRARCLCAVMVIMGRSAECKC